jgi:hypothetical protein
MELHQMKRVCASAVTLALVGAAAPLWAGVIYVPVIPLEGHEIRIAASNNHPDTAWPYEAHLLPLNSDGTVHDRSQPTGISVQPLRTTQAVVPSLSIPGLLEISTPPQLGFTATILPAGSNNSPDNIGTPLPIITSHEAHDADSWLMIQGLQRSANGTETDVGVVNLGHASARCHAFLVAADGESLGDALLDLRPLTMAYFTDVVGLFGQNAAVDVLLRLRCDEAFYSFAVIKNGAAGAIKVRGPAARGTSLLHLPGEEPPPSQPPPSEPAPPPDPGTVVFTRNGVFHAPTPGNDTAIHHINVGPHRTFSRVTVRFDYTHGGWFPGAENHNHSLFWLHRGGIGHGWLGWFGHIYGYVNIFGPNRDELRNMISVNVTGPHANFKRPVQPQIGSTYRVEYLYNGAAGHYEAKMTDLATGAVIGTVSGGTTGPIRSEGGGLFAIYFGHENAHGHGPERPSYGSVWRDLRVEFIP